MKELYGEGPASHTDPESCVVSRKAGHEALTGAHAGGALSREISGNQDADAVYSAGRQHWWARHREHPLDLRGQRPRSEEHTSELQSRFDLVCRLLLEKKKIKIKKRIT